MCASPICLIIELTIPRPLSEPLTATAALKAYLQAQGVWPQGVIQERWRVNTVTPGWVVTLEVPVPVPPVAPKENV